MKIFNCFRHPAIPQLPPIKERLLDAEKRDQFKEFFDKLSKLIVALPSWRSLLLVHGDAFLKDTDFEGGLAHEQAHLFKGFLDLIADPSSILKPQFDGENRERIKSLVEDLVILSAEQSDAISAKISNSLNKNGAALIFLNYAGSGTAPGHAFGLFLERNKKNQLVCHFLNRGEGINLNAKKTVTHQEPFALSFAPIILNNSDFFSGKNLPDELHFLTQLQKFANIAPKGDARPYESKEIYELFLKIGSFSGSSNSAYGTVSPQRSGTCADQALRLMARFVIERYSKNHETALHEYKSLMFYYKAYSLLLMGAKLKQEQVDSPLTFIKESVTEFALTSRKRFDAQQIAPAEYEFATTLSDWILQELSEVKQPAQTESLSSAFVNPKTTYRIKHRDTSSIFSSIKTTPVSSKLKAFPQVTPFNLKTFLIDLPQDSALFDYVVLEIFPTPIYAADPFWDQIPEKDLEFCLSQIFDLFHSYQDEKNSKHVEAMLFLSILAIADKLVRRIDPEAMENRYFHTFVEKADPSIFYFIGSEAVRFSALLGYFKETAKNNRVPLFHHTHKDEYNLSYEAIYYLVQKNLGHNNSLYHHWTFLESIAISPCDSSKNRSFAEYTADLFDSDVKEPNKNLKGVWKNYYSHFEYLCQNIQSGLLNNYIRGFNRRQTPGTHTIRSSPSGIILSNHVLYQKDQIQEFQRNLDRYNSLFNTSFNRIFTKLDEDQENRILVNPPLKHKYDQRYGDDVFRLVQMAKQSETLRVGSAIKYLDECFFEVKQNDIFFAIEWILLADTHLIKSVITEPNLASALRAVLDKHLDFELKSCSSNWDSFLRWMTFAYHIETHLMETPIRDSCLVRIENLQNIIEGIIKDFEERDRFALLTPKKKKKIEHDLHTCLAYFSSHLPNADQRAERALFWFSTNNQNKFGGNKKQSRFDGRWALGNKLDLASVYEERINFASRRWKLYDKRNTPDSQPQTVEYFVSLLPKMYRDLAAGAVLEINNEMPTLVLSNGSQVSFDYNDYSLLVDGQKLQPTSIRSEQEVFLGKVFGENLPRFVAVWEVDKQLFYSVDGKFRLFGTLLDQKFPFDQSWFRYCASPFDNLGWVAPGKSHDKFWQNEAGRIVVTRNEVTNVIAREDQKILYLTDSEGNFDPNNSNKLLESWQQFHWNHLLWGDAQGYPRRVEFISKSDWLPFDAEVTPSGKIIFRSEKWKDYVLAENQTSQAIGKLSQYILLEKLEDATQKLIVVPYVSQGSWSSPKEIGLPPESSKNPFFAYEVDARHERLHAQSVGGHLYLAYLNIIQNDFEAANQLIRILNPQRLLSNDDIDIAKMILKQNGNHPTVLALKLRIGLALIDNEIHKEIQQGVLDDPSATKSDDFTKHCSQKLTLFNSLLEIYQEYISVQTSPLRGPCPESIRLTAEEEKRLLKYVYNQTKRILELLPKSAKVIRMIGRGFLYSDLQTPLVVNRRELLGIHGSLWDSLKEMAFKILQRCQWLSLGGNIYELPYNFWKSIWLIDRFYDNKKPHYSTLKDIRFASVDGVAPRNQEIFNLGKNFLLRALQYDSVELAKFDLDFQLIIKQQNPAKLISGDKNRWAYLSLAGLMRNYPFLFRGISRELSESKYIERVAERADKLTLFLSIARMIPKLFTWIIPDFSRVRIWSWVRSKKPSKINTVFQRAACRNSDYGKNESVKTFPITGHTVKSLEESSVKMMEQIQSILSTPSEEQIEAMTAVESLKALNYINELQQGEKRKIDLYRDLIPYVLRNDPKVLQKQNPFLTEEHCKQLYTLTIDYLSACTSAEWLKKQDHPEASFERHYDIYANPELLVYEYMAGTVLRCKPDQALLLKNIFHALFPKGNEPVNVERVKHYFFEFQAGGGKTKVLAAILCQVAILEGKLPIFFTLPDIHNITLDDLSTTMARCFGIKTKELTISQGTILNADKLKNIYIVLKQALNHGEVIVSQPETYHALYLAWQDALNAGEKKKIHYHSKIDALMKHHALFLVDEAHRNEDPLLQANHATGIPLTIPADQNNLLIAIYKILAGVSEERLYLEDNRELSDILQLRQNKQALINVEEMQLIMKRIAVWACNDQKINPEMIPYLLDIHERIPQELENLRNGSDTEQEKAQLIFFLRGLLTTVLPHVLSLVDEMDYALGPDGVAIPCHQKTPSTAKFESADVAAAHTLQSLLQRGITEPAHMRTFMLALLSIMKNQLYEIPEGEMTPIEQDFIKWQNELGCKTQFLLRETHPASFDNKAYLKELILAIGRHPEAVQLYYQECLAKKIVVFPHKWISTASDFSNNSWATLHFSATLGEKAQYPRIGNQDRYELDHDFVKDVCAQALTEQNRSTLWLNEQNPLAFYQDLFEQLSIEKFSKLQGVINVGGWAKGANNEDWGRQFLTFAAAKNLEFDGVVYAKDHHDLDSGNLVKHLYLLLKTSETPIQLEGSNLTKEMNRLGISNARVFKIYGPSETTGTDLALSPNMNMVLMIGENLRQSNLVQAIMRMRGFLLPAMNQGLIWVGSEEIRAQILASTGGSEPEHILEWTKINEADHQKKAVLTRAYQEIEYAFHSLIKEQIRNKLGQPSKQAALFKKHLDAFLYKLGRDTYDLYGTTTTSQETRGVLESYRDDFSKRAKISLEEYPEAAAQIAQVINETVGQIEYIEAAHQPNLSAQMQQKQRQEQKQEQKQKQKQKNNISFIYRAATRFRYAENKLRLNSTGLLSKSPADCQTANHYFATDIFSEQLFLAHNVTHTLHNRFVPFTSAFGLKRIERLLVVETNGNKRFFAIDLQDAASYIKQIRDLANTNSATKAAIITTNGVIEQNGKGDWAIAGLADYVKGQEFRQIQVQVELMNGQVVHKKDFNTFKGRATVEKILKVWNRVKKERLVLRDLIDDGFFIHLAGEIYTQKT